MPRLLQSAQAHKQQALSSGLAALTMWNADALQCLLWSGLRWWLNIKVVTPQPLSPLVTAVTEHLKSTHTLRMACHAELRLWCLTAMLHAQGRGVVQRCTLPFALPEIGFAQLSCGSEPVRFCPLVKKRCTNTYQCSSLCRHTVLAAAHRSKLIRQSLVQQGLAAGRVAQQQRVVGCWGRQDSSTSR